MARTKIDYGIDLGTTNSAIARMEDGKTIIKRSLDENNDITPSCVAFKPKSMLVGASARRQYRSEREDALSKGTTQFNSFIEFKRTMGTDKLHHTSHQNKSLKSEELSSEVLKKLRSYVQDDQIKSIVVTVPQKFTINQKDATAEAARLAGFEHCLLLAEPIAAAMAFGLSEKNKNGHWLVFDFGGGTFDAALVKVEEGIIKIPDTDGDNYLGGKNLDFAVVEEILIPYLQSNYDIQSHLGDDNRRDVLHEVLKFEAENIKNQLSFNDSVETYVDPGDFGVDDNGQEIEIDLITSQNDLETVFAPIFQKSIDISKSLLAKNNLSGKDLSALILVGGPTRSPILRRMLKEQITEKVDTSIDPMTAVAHGAALFAATKDIPENIIDENRDRSRVQLGLGYVSTTIDNEELVTVNLLRDKSDGDIPDRLFAEIVRADKFWASGRVLISEAGEVVKVKLLADRVNGFDVFLYDGVGNSLLCEPDSFSIIQGIGIGNSTLSYNIAVGIRSQSKSTGVVKIVKGLEKNKSLPAIGTTNGYKTQNFVRPGVIDDTIEIPVYEVEDDDEYSKFAYNQHVFTAVIKGDEVETLVPAGSPVDLTVKVSNSGIELSAFFPGLDFTHEARFERHNEPPIDADWLETEISRAKQSLEIIERENGDSFVDKLKKLNADIAELEKLLEQGRGDYDRKKQVLDNLRRCFRKIDKIEDATEWPTTEKSLKDTFYRLEEYWAKVEGHTEDLDDTRVKEAIAQFKEQVPKIIKDKNVRLAQELIEDMNSLHFALSDAAMGVRMYIQWMKEWDEEFDLYKWSDPNKARILINQGLSMSANNPTKESMRALNYEIAILQPGRHGPKFQAFQADERLLTDQ